MSQKNVDMDDASSDEDTDTDTDDEDEDEGKVFSPSELRAKNERSRKRLEQKLRSMREDLYERTALEFREMEEVKARLLENVRRLKEMHRDDHQTATNGEEEEEEEEEEEDDREIERLEKQLEEEKEKQRRMLLREKEEGKKTT